MNFHRISRAFMYTALELHKAFESLTSKMVSTHITALKRPDTPE